MDFPASFLRTCWVLRDHGIQFVEGETATPGALMATLRHLPPLLEIAAEVQRHTDGAWLHVTNNPMPRLVHGIIQGAGYQRVVGHCHGALQTRERIAALTDTMRALSGEAPPYFYLAANLPNAGHIPNLPEGAVVELPATVTAEGVALHRCPGPLPLLFEIWVRQHLAVHDLSVRAVLEHRRQAAIEAIACDPVFRDCDCSPGQLLDELLAANQGLVPALH